eukprot:scaffold137014_cov18-Prasinocladus_malaysianus.AAC.1
MDARDSDICITHLDRRQGLVPESSASSSSSLIDDKPTASLAALRLLLAHPSPSLPWNVGSDVGLVGAFPGLVGWLAPLDGRGHLIIVSALYRLERSYKHWCGSHRCREGHLYILGPVACG